MAGSLLDFGCHCLPPAENCGWEPSNHPSDCPGWDPVADFDLAALAAFNAAFPYQAGLLVDSPTELYHIIHDLLCGIPALYTGDRQGKFFLQELTPPAGAPLLILDNPEILGNPEGEALREEVFRKVYLNYDRNYTVDANPTGLLVAREQWLKKEYRQVARTNNAVRANYPRARDLGPLDTCLINRADVEAVGDKLLALYGTQRQKLAVEANIEAFLRNLGDPVQVRGYLQRLVGLDLDFTARRAELDVWRQRAHVRSPEKHLHLVGQPLFRRGGVDRVQRGGHAAGPEPPGPPAHPALAH
jgi:hypothetical protein